MLSMPGALLLFSTSMSSFISSSSGDYTSSPPALRSFASEAFMPFMLRRVEKVRIDGRNALFINYQRTIFCSALYGTGVERLP